MNAFVALLTPHSVWPSPLSDVGYRLAGLEVPTTTDLTTTRLDAVAFESTSNHLLIAEAKSGRNADLEQANKLSTLDPQGIVRTASVTLRAEQAPSVEVVYVCLEQHAEPIVNALERNGTPFPVVSVAKGELRHRGAPFTAKALAHRLHGVVSLPGPPPSVLRFDEETTVEELLPRVRSELVADQSHRRDIITVRALTERVVPQYAFFGKRTQGVLRDRVERASRQVVEELPEDFLFRPRTQGHDEPAIQILRTPEDLDRRGRTQGYQRLARAAQRRPLKPRPPLPGHLQLFKELDELAEDDEAQEQDDNP